MMRARTAVGAAVALALSGGLHAAGLVMAVPSAPPVLVEGGGAAEVAALGAAFADFAAGSVPVVPAVQPPVMPDELPASRPVPTAQPPETPVAPPVAVTAIQSATADTALPADVPPSIVPDLAATASSPATIPAVPAARSSPAAPPATTVTPNESASATTVAPETATVAISDIAPRTSRRPMPRSETRPQVTRRPEATAVRPAGNAEVDARRGSATGQENARATASSSASGQGQAAGNAAVANYPGQVVRQITRLRRPRAPDRGAVTVAFSISRSGALASASIARSSGSAALDRVALDHIRRAAPFPAPPPGAQTSFSFEFVGRP